MVDLKIPARIQRLNELANNLWWSWHNRPRRLFRTLDYPLWRLSGHNPVKQLHEVTPEVLQRAAKDPAFLDLYDSVMAEFDADMTAQDTWFATSHPGLLSGPVAYFSMEYAIHNSLPIYAGGLGILAGDLCKEASDLGLPMVAIGFAYPLGYFHQHISHDGWQQEIYQQLDFTEAPISRVLSPKGEKVVARVLLGKTNLGLGVWQVKVGRTDIYLLDTNIEENPAEYHHLSARLYVADRELRMQQEMVLGVGGVRVLRALGISPAVWHANEGHTAFMTMERVREQVEKGVSFDDAVNRVRATTVFTTHTPVQAGHDVFPLPEVESCYGPYCSTLGVDCGTLLRLGRPDDLGTPVLNMTALCLRMANQRCAVSQLHEKVTQRMWHVLWPEVPENRVPISHVTNGVHMASWLAPELHYLFDKYLEKDWMKKQDDPRVWDGVLNIPDEEFWACHQQLKRKLVDTIQARMRSRWLEDNVPLGQMMMAMGALLDTDALTIAFARRFVEYKRPALLFRDMERLKRIVTNPWHPVQIVFAGKSHPSDFPSKHLLRQVYTLAAGREYQGRLAFVEDYDIHVARYLVQGVDLWLNTPRRLQEACGTSGMKASLNGVPHLSVRDGWWHEGYNGNNGWALGSDSLPAQPEDEDDADAGALYQLLEEEVVPRYYARDRSGVPHNWIRLAKETIRSTAPVFCARRMLKEYTELMYQPIARPKRSH